LKIEESFVLYNSIPNFAIYISHSLYPADLKVLLCKLRSRAKSAGQRKLLCLAYLCVIFIAQAGDIEQNPGPDFPCKICLKECDWTTYSVQCDECDHWFHAECMQMNISTEYAALEDNDVVWICSSCGEPNYSSSLFSSYLATTSNSFSTLSSVSSEDDIMSPMAASSPKSFSNVSTHTGENRTHTGEKRTKWSQKPKCTKSRAEKTNKISVMTVNFQSINNKVGELAICLNSYKPDILVGTESWLSEDTGNSEIFPPDYNVIRKDRPPNRRDQSHGGIFIAVRKDLIVSHRSDLDEDCEILWIQLELVGAKQIVLGAFYRPPDSGPDVLDKLRSSLSKIDMNKCSNIWLAGDFNLSHVDWESQQTITDCPKPGLCRQFISIANDFHLDQMVRKPTRGPNILDLFLTSNSSLVDHSDVLPGMSDHDGIPFVSLNTKPKINKSKPRKVYSYCKADWDSIRNDLAEISSDFDDICLDMVDVNDMWTDLKCRINKTVDKNIPSKVITPNKKVPWVDRKVSSLLRKKKKAFDKAKVTDTADDWEVFRTLRKCVNRTARSNFRKYVRNTCATSTKKFYSLIKNLRRDSFGITTLKSKDGLVSENAQKAEALNQQFKSVFTQENLNNIPTMPHSDYTPMPDIHITTTGIEKLLTDLDPSKASGPDGVSARILKMGAKEIAPALATIFRRSFETGI
jgi:hypothetical protein